jgi:hypothetical protein
MRFICQWQTAIGQTQYGRDSIGSETEALSPGFAARFSRMGVRYYGKWKSRCQFFVLAKHKNSFCSQNTRVGSPILFDGDAIIGRFGSSWL